MSVFLKTLGVVAGMGLVSSWGAGAAAASPFSTTLSVREIYDNNVFIQDNAPLAPGQTTAALPAAAAAMITDIGANLGWSWKTGPALQLDAAYAPEIFRFSKYQTENHTDHRFSGSAAGATDAWRYEAKASYLITDGSHESPVFNRLGGSPPIGSEPVRARRAQEISKVNGRLTRDFPGGFVRGVFALMDQDFHTRQSSAAGYANYVDRGEWSSGIEAGWKLRPDLYLVAGCRGGRQHQADLLNEPLAYTNTFSRWLLGAEGKLSRTLKFNVLAGPDVRQFGPQVRPGFDRHQTTTYAEMGATWTPTTTDSLNLSGRRYLWVSSGGRSIYVDSLYDLNWKHSLTHAWNLTAGVNLHSAVTGCFNPSAPRDDTIYAVTGGMTYTIDPKTKLDFGFAQDWSVSQVPHTPGRKYHRLIGNLGCSRQW